LPVPSFWPLLARIFLPTVLFIQLRYRLFDTGNEESLQTTRIGRGREVRPILMSQVIELVEVFRVPVEQSNHHLKVGCEPASLD
jgi:hypothetical protein